MRKLLWIALFALASCGGDDDCEAAANEIRANFEAQIERVSTNTNMSRDNRDAEIGRLNREMAIRIAEVCE